jgi:hypothetical protein
MDVCAVEKKDVSLKKISSFSIRVISLYVQICFYFRNTKKKQKTLPFKKQVVLLQEIIFG